MSFNPKVTNVKKRLQRKAKKQIKFGQEFQYEDDFSEWFNGLLMHFFPDDLTYFHVENERKTTLKAGARRKRKGVKPGVSDWLWLKYSAAIELKQPGKKTTPSQKAFLEAAKALGWKTYVIHSKVQAFVCVADLSGIPLAKLQQYDALKQTSKYTGHKPHITELTKGNNND